MEANQDEPKSLLSNLRGHHVVLVHNPLTDVPEKGLKGDFTWQTARSVIQLDERSRDPHIDKLGLRNDSHPTQKHVVRPITIPSGTSMRLPGDVAQVLVKHLVDEMMQREGQKQQMADPVLRREYEERVILNVNDLVHQLSTQTIEEQLDQQIADLNREEPRNEQANTQPAPGTGEHFSPSQETGSTDSVAGGEEISPEFSGAGTGGEQAKVSKEPARQSR